VVKLMVRKITQMVFENMRQALRRSLAQMLNVTISSIKLTLKRPAPAASTTSRRLLLLPLLNSEAHMQLEPDPVIAMLEAEQMQEATTGENNRHAGAESNSEESEIDVEISGPSADRVQRAATTLQAKPTAELSSTLASEGVELTVDSVQEVAVTPASPGVEQGPPATKPNESDGSGLSGGTIAGIVVGGLIGIGLIFGVVYTYRALHSQKKTLTQEQVAQIRAVSTPNAPQPPDSKPPSAVC